MERIENPAWESVQVTLPDGNDVEHRLPRRRTPALARVGMVVEVCINCDCVYGTIQEVTVDYAIVVCEDGEAVAVRWPAVLLGAVQPDPRELTGTRRGLRERSMAR